MITVLRRCSIPKEKVEEFGQRWLSEIVPELVRQPGFVRAEVYAADVQGHWVTSLSWEDEQSRSKPAEHFAELYNEFERYERFSAGRSHAYPSAPDGLGETSEGVSRQLGRTRSTRRGRRSTPIVAFKSRIVVLADRSQAAPKREVDPHPADLLVLAVLQLWDTVVAKARRAAPDGDVAVAQRELADWVVA